MLRRGTGAREGTREQGMEQSARLRLALVIRVLVIIFIFKCGAEIIFAFFVVILVVVRKDFIFLIVLIVVIISPGYAFYFFAHYDIVIFAFTFALRHKAVFAFHASFPAGAFIEA